MISMLGLSGALSECDRCVISMEPYPRLVTCKTAKIGQHSTATYITRENRLPRDIPNFISWMLFSAASLFRRKFKQRATRQRRH